MRGLRSGEWLALIAGFTLAIMLALRWYDTPVSSPDLKLRGVTAIGWPIVVLLAISVLAALLLAAVTVLRRSPSAALAVATLGWVYGVVAFLVLAIRMIGEPDLGVGLASSQVDARWPAYVGLIAALLIPVGAFRSLKDERTDAADAAYTPPPPRTPPTPINITDSGRHGSS